MNETHPVYRSVDVFKFVAAILVVAIHSKPFIFSADLDYYFTCLCRTAVPFFFVSTGYFFFLKEKPNIRKYTRRLSTLYVLWFVIELPFVWQRFFAGNDHSVLLLMFNFLRCLIFSNTWYASWFIMACIISMNIIYYLSNKLSNRQLLLLSGVGYVLSLACSGYYGVLDTLLSERLIYCHAAFSSYFMPANSFIVAMIYVVLGKIIAERVREGRMPFSRRRNLALFLGVAILGAIEVCSLRWSASISDAFLFLPFFASLSLMLLLRSDVNVSPTASKLMRSMSILIYILHPIFLAINPSVFGIGEGPAMFCITLIESTITAWLIVRLSDKVPALRRLY